MRVMDFFSYIFCLLAFFAYAQCQPYRYTTQKQACGDKLADIMSLVCSGRGYNVAFKPQEGSRRTRRGIVEECCRRSCTQDILELYCRPEVPENPPNVQIRKRSDNLKSFEEDDNNVPSPSTTNPNTKDMREEIRKTPKPLGLIGILTRPSTEIPNTIADVLNKEATQKTIQEKLNKLYQEHKVENRIFHSVAAVESEKTKKLVETNYLGYISNDLSKETRAEENNLHKEEPNTLLKDETNVMYKEDPMKRPLTIVRPVESNRHRHSRKTVHRHPANRVLVKNDDEAHREEFQIGVRKPYYDRKQSRPRGHHLHSH